MAKKESKKTNKKVLKASAKKADKDFYLDEKPKLVSIGQAAKILGVSVDTIRRWDKEGILHSERPDGKNRHFNVQELEAVKFSQPLTISEASEQLNLSPSTLRRIEKKGLISPERNEKGERVYTRKVVEEFIRSEYFMRQKEVEEEILKPLNGDHYGADEEEKSAHDGATHAVLGEHETHITKLNKFKRVALRTLTGIAAFFFTVVTLLTILFLLFPESTGSILGYYERGLPDSKQYIFKEPDSLVARQLKPFSQAALRVVETIDPNKRNEIDPPDDIPSVNDVFGVDSEGNISSLYTFTVPDTSYLHIPDQGLVVNLNSDYLRGYVPGEEDGDLAILPIGGESITDGSLSGLDIRDGSITQADLGFELSLNTGGTTVVSGGGITTLFAGTGLTGGGSGSAVSIDVGVGNGLSGSADLLSIDASTTGVTTLTGSNSGLEVTTDGLRLLGGCSNSQVLAWNSAAQQWQCTTNSGGGGGSPLTVRESDGSPNVANVTTLQFGPTTDSDDEFIVTDLGGGSVRVSAGTAIVQTTTSPAAGDISGTYSSGFTINPNSVALGTDTTGNYIETIIVGNGLNVSGVGSETATATINLDVLTTGTTATSSSNSGLELTADGLRLLGGCANNQILKWNSASSVWQCAADGGGGGGGSSIWSDLLDPTADLTLNHDLYTTTFNWGGSSPVTQPAQDSLTLTYTNDGTSDPNTQRLLVLKNQDNGINDLGNIKTETLIRLEHNDDSTLDKGIEIIGSVSPGGFINTGLDVSDGNIRDAVDVGANNIVGTTADIEFDNLDFNGSFGIFELGALAIYTGDGDTTYSSGGGGVLVLDSSDGQIITDNGDVLLLGSGVADGLAYHAITNSGGAANSGLVTDDNDLYIQGALEVDGSVNLGSNLTILGTTIDASTVTSFDCSDCIDFDDLEDALNIDASTSVAFSGNNFTFNMDGLGDFIIQDNGSAYATFADNGITTLTHSGVGTKTDNLVVNNSGTGTVTNAIHVNSQTGTITNGLFVENTGGTLGSGVRIGTGAQTIGTALNIASTGVLTDIRLQNGETIDNDTDGLILFTSANVQTTGNLIVGNGSGNDTLQFEEEATNPGCVLGEYKIWANSTENLLKKCQNGALSDLDAAGAWNQITPPTDVLDLNHQEFYTHFLWDTDATAEEVDYWTFSSTNDASTDVNIQRLLVVANNDDGAATGSTEALLVVENNDTNEVVPDGIVVSSASGGIATAIDIDSTNITTDLELQNDLTIDNDDNNDLNITENGVTLNIDFAEAEAGAVKFISSSELEFLSNANSADAIEIEASVGGIDILAVGASAGEDIDITASSSINLTSTEGVSDAIDIQAASTSGGVTLGAGTNGVDVDSTGELNLNSSQASVSALRFIASNANGGIDIDSSAGGITVDTSGALSIDANGTASNISLNSNSAADDFTVSLTGSTDSSLILSSTGTAADALQILASGGGIDITASGSAGEDLDLLASNSSVNITSNEGVSDAITINASGSGGAVRFRADAENAFVFQDESGNTLFTFKDKLDGASNYGVLNLTAKTTNGKPATCAVGDVYANDSANNSGLYYCYATNNWRKLDNPENGYNEESATDVIGTTNTVLITTSVTPSATENDVWVTGTVQFSAASTADTITFSAFRGTTCVGPSVQVGQSFSYQSSVLNSQVISFSVVDTGLNTTAATSYTICAIKASGLSGTQNATSKSINVHEITNGTGADLAEVYYSNDETIVPGEVVAVDSTLHAGVKRASGAYNRNALGIVSTKPGQVLSDGSDAGAPVVVALAGRVPVKVNLENGPIKPGDKLTTSSVPGEAMKATKAGLVIGHAMGEYDGNGAQTVMVLVGTQWYGGEFSDILPAGLSLENAEQGGFAQAVLAGLRENHSTQPNEALSELYADKIVAGLELVTPRVTTNALTVVDETGGKTAELLENGDAFFAGELSAKAVRSEQIVGTDIGQQKYSHDDSLSLGELVSIDTSLKHGVKRSAGAYEPTLVGVVGSGPSLLLEQEGVGNEVMVVASGTVSVRANNESGSIKPGDLLTSSSTPGVAMKATKEGPIVGRALTALEGQSGTVIVRIDGGYGYGDIVSEISNLDGRVTSLEEGYEGLSTQFDELANQEPVELNSGQDIDWSSLSVGELKVQESLTVGGALVVGGDAEFRGQSVFHKLVSFMDRTIFGSDVEFRGDVTFNQNSAGYAQLEAGKTTVEVEFATPLDSQPLITLGLGGGQFVNYSYQNVTERGFEIVIDSPQENDLMFTWNAVQIRNAEVSGL